MGGPLAFPSPGRGLTGARARAGALVEKLASGEGLPCVSCELTAGVRGPGCCAQRCPLVFADCAGCKEEIKHGQSLLALDKQWHVSCFKCQTCSVILTGEYISKWVPPAWPHAWPCPGLQRRPPRIPPAPPSGCRQHVPFPEPPPGSSASAAPLGPTCSQSPPQTGSRLLPAPWVPHGPRSAQHRLQLRIYPCPLFSNGGTAGSHLLSVCYGQGAGPLCVGIATVNPLPAP